MALLKFNKSELVNLSYSLKREIIAANKVGAYCNTSIVACNTRRYHGLLAVTLDRFGGDKYLLLSSLDETLVVDGKQFNLGIHCYGDIHEPRGHKYVVDFSADGVPQITYKVGEIVFRKSLLLAPDHNQILIRFELLQAPSKVTLQLKPFLAFRNIHALTRQNPEADTTGRPVAGGAAFRMYRDFPDLYLQLSGSGSKFLPGPCWYNNVTYSDEYRRGFDCREDLLVPGHFERPMKEGDTAVFSAALHEETPAGLKAKFARLEKATPVVHDIREQLRRWADIFVCTHNGHKKITAGFSWLYTGLLRETLMALPGLVLTGKGDAAEFEEILDNLLSDEQERLFHRTTQIEAPLRLATALQAYLDFGADPAAVWKKYGDTLKKVIESYAPDHREEVALQPNGLLWAQKERTALTWMSAYINGWPVTERAGYQVETNALWYNALCFALEMEAAWGKKTGKFVKTWTPVRDLARANYQPLFWNDENGCLADYVDNAGQHREVRPNQLYALWVKYSPIDEELAPAILRVIDAELLTARGIRTLSPRDNRYKGVYEGSQTERDLAYHGGSARPWLLAPYVDVCFRVKGPSFGKKAEWLVEGFFDDLNKHGVGAFAELYDGDPPHEPHGAISSALSTASLLEIYRLMEKNK